MCRQASHKCMGRRVIAALIVGDSCKFSQRLHDAVEGQRSACILQKHALAFERAFA